MGQERHPVGRAAAKPELAPTTPTAAVLPLKPGTWYYRVRGINFQLGGNAQHMSWSERPGRARGPTPKFTVAKPKKK